MFQMVKSMEIWYRPAKNNNYTFKVKNRNTGTRYYICPKLTRQTPVKHH